MKLFLHYLRSKALKIGAFLLFALLFLVSFRLYHLPLAAVWYPSALCAALGLVILLLDFRRVRQRHLELQQILKSLPTLPETIPQPQAVLEEDYRALTRALLAQQRTLETQLNSRIRTCSTTIPSGRTRSRRPSPPCAFPCSRRIRPRPGS